MDLSRSILASVLAVAFALLGGGFQSVTPQVANAQTGDIAEITNPIAEVSGTTTLEAEFTGTTTPTSSGDHVSFAVRTGQCGDAGSTVFGNVDGHNDPYTYSTSTGEFSAEFDTTTTEDGDYCFIFNPNDEGDTARDTVNFVINNVEDTSEVDLTVTKTVDGGAATSSDFIFEILDENNDPLEFTLDGVLSNEFEGSAEGADLSFVATSSATTTYTVNEVSGTADYTPTFAGDCTAAGEIAVNPSNDSSYVCNVVNEFTGTTTGTTTASADIQQPEPGEVTSGTTSLEATYNDGDDENEGVSFAVRAGQCDNAGETVFGNVNGHDDPYNFDGEHFSAEFDTTTTEDGDYCFVFNPNEDNEVQNDVRETRNFEIQNDEHEPAKTGTIQVCKTVLDENGEIDESRLGTQFGINLASATNTDASVTFNTPLDYDDNIYTNASNDASCVAFDRPVGSYEYTSETVSGTTTASDWSTTYDDDLRVRDQRVLNAGSAFGATSDSDGMLHVSENATTTLAVVNRLERVEDDDDRDEDAGTTTLRRIVPVTINNENINTNKNVNRNVNDLSEALSDNDLSISQVNESERINESESQQEPGVGGSPGVVRGDQDDAPSFPDTGDGTGAESPNDLGWSFFGAFAGILALSGVVYQTTTPRKRELFE